MQASHRWLMSSEALLGAAAGRTGCAPLTHYTVNYRMWGEGPPLILIPGLAGGVDLVAPLAQVLARDYCVISYQLRAEDDSFALRRSFGLNDLVQDLAEFLDWHCLESPTVLGVSFGGILALEFASRFPQRLDRLIVQGVGARFERGLVHLVARTVLTRFWLPSDNPFINQFFNLLFGKAQEDGPLFRFVTRRCWQTDQSVMAHRFRMAEEFDMHPRLGRIRAPTLILHGERDLLVPERSLRSLRQGIHDAEVVRWADCGHLAFVTHPGRVADEVQQFAGT